MVNLLNHYMGVDNIFGGKKVKLAEKKQMWFLNVSMNTISLSFLSFIFSSAVSHIKQWVPRNSMHQRMKSSFLTGASIASESCQSKDEALEEKKVKTLILELHFLPVVCWRKEQNRILACLRSSKITDLLLFWLAYLFLI